LFILFERAAALTPVGCYRLGRVEAASNLLAGLLSQPFIEDQPRFRPFDLL
jgi:hypothetical protein